MQSKIITHSENGNTTYLADNSYLAIGVEATAGTAVIPSKFVPLISSDVKTVANYSADRRMKGVSWKTTGMLRGNRMHEGTLTVLADPDTIGHFLNMVMARSGTSSSGSPLAYTHNYAVGTPKSYTIEIKKGLYAERYFGVYIDELKLEVQDGAMVIVASIKAMGSFSVATLGVALTGAGMTGATLDDEYDISPNNGLVAADVITTAGGTDITLSSVNANGIAVAFSSTSVTASVGDAIYLKPQTPSFATLQDPFYLGNVFAGFGATTSAAATAAGARSTSTPVYDLAITIKNNLFAQNGSSRLDPVQILQGSKECQIELKQLFTTAAQRQAWLNRTKQAVTFVFNGKYIASNFTTQEKLTLTFNNIKALTSENEIKVGEYIVDDQVFEVIYDTGDAAAMSGVLINRTDSSTAY